ncbi:MAG: CpaD family pilus assembly protein [Caulobacteraceae bacterium]
MWSNRLLLAATAALSLSACASTGTVGNDDALTPTERFGITVTPQPVELRLAPHAGGISQNQAAALTEFTQGWRDIDGGMITLRAPGNGADPAAARATLETARRFLIDQGVDPAKIQLAGYDAGGDPTAPVVVGYARYTAQGPDCSQAWPNMTATMNNREYENFGCAVTANMAAMIDNPGDVLQPRTMTPADAGRRATVLGRYRAGEVTSSAADAQANGAVSRAVD